MKGVEDCKSMHLMPWAAWLNAEMATPAKLKFYTLRVPERKKAGFRRGGLLQPKSARLMRTN